MGQVGDPVQDHHPRLALCKVRMLLVQEIQRLKVTIPIKLSHAAATSQRKPSQQHPQPAGWINPCHLGTETPKSFIPKLS